VAIVVLLFLQNWRSAIIPLIAVPVAIIGSFAALAVFGFSLNNLTLFGLVLAIGIVVDDAIVVVEAVEHHIERGLAPRAATIRAMDEVSGPVIAIGLVLSAVFVPCAFISGIVGQFFRQFAMTISVSTIISAFNSLTLSPALAAVLLRPRSRTIRQALPRPAYVLLGGWAGWVFLAPWLEPRMGGWLVSILSRSAPSLGIDLGSSDSARWAAALLALAAGGATGWLAGRPFDRLLAGFFALFNAAFRSATTVYSRLVGSLLRVGALVLLVYGGLMFLTYWGFQRTPSGFIPSQDMGYLLINVQAPDSTSAERMQDLMNRIETIARTVPGVKFAQTMSGMSLLLSANGSNFGSMFIILDKFSERRKPELYSDVIAQTLRNRYAEEVPDAIVTVLGPPPVRGVGRAGGFKLMIEDRGDVGLETLQGQTDNLVDKAKQEKDFVGITSVFRANVPQVFVDVNRRECMSKQVALQDLFDTMRIFMGSLYVNDFNRFGRTWQVIVQAEAKFRNRIDYLKRLQVRNAEGKMVPLGSLASVKEVNGPLVLTRYNMYPAAFINGAAAPGVSSGDAIALMERLAHESLLRSMSFEWTDLAFLELQAGNTAMIVFGFAVVMVFLVLAAQYESWSLPLAVILVVPMCLLSGIVGVNFARQLRAYGYGPFLQELGRFLGVRFADEDINIFTQIGFVVLVGLASKNAILIVEFAKHRREAGDPRRRAALEACTLRLRPIIMTSLAFILGVIPLIRANGAGAEMRRTLGLTVFSGMLGVTLFGIFLTPVFFTVIDWLGESRLFGSPRLRRVHTVLLAILSLSFLRRPRRPAPAPRPAPTPARSGELVEHK
jgi:multidrug efflux pump